MRREDFVDILSRIPEFDHAKLQIVMRAGMNFSIDTVMRLEANYAVVRGREAGNQDEGRAFFVSFDEIVGIKLERIVKMAEFHEWYSDLPAMLKKGNAESLAAAKTAAAAVAEPAPQDPAEIARQNLLDRIRAARSVVKK